MVSDIVDNPWRTFECIYLQTTLSRTENQCYILLLGDSIFGSLNQHGEALGVEAVKLLFLCGISYFKFISFISIPLDSDSQILGCWLISDQAIAHWRVIIVLIKLECRNVE